MSDTFGRYGPNVAMFLCRSCGCFIWDKDRHDAWHLVLSELMNLVGRKEE